MLIQLNWYIFIDTHWDTVPRIVRVLIFWIIGVENKQANLQHENDKPKTCDKHLCAQFAIDCIFNFAFSSHLVEKAKSKQKRHCLQAECDCTVRARYIQKVMPYKYTIGITVMAAARIKTQNTIWPVSRIFF